MPNTGTPRVNTEGGALGGSASVTDSGPPERTTPLGLNARTSSSEMSQGRISQYTPNSRTRRAINCVYWAPKSRIRIRCAWISGDPVIGGLFGNADVVDMALTHTGVGNPHEHGTRSHLLDVFAAGISHGRTQSARKLMEYLHDTALVGHPSLDSFRHQLLELGGGVLEV